MYFTVLTLNEIIESQVTGTPSDTEIIDNGGETKWYPQRKLDIVKRKLNGENPARNYTNSF